VRYVTIAEVQPIGGSNVYSEVEVLGWAVPISPPVWFNMAGMTFDSTAARYCTPYALSEEDAVNGRWTIGSCRWPVCNFGAATGGTARGPGVTASSAYGIASGFSPDYTCPSADFPIVYTDFFDSPEWDTEWDTLLADTRSNNPGSAKIYVYVEKGARYEVGASDPTGIIHTSAGTNTYRL
jgi:hypothetical protein